MPRTGKRRKLTRGTVLALTMTALVCMGCVSFLALIADGGWASRTSGAIAALSGRNETIAPEIGQTYIQTDIQPTLEPEPAEEERKMTVLLQATQTPMPQPITVTLAASGTVYVPKAVRQSAQKDKEYDFSEIFAGIGDVLKAADLALVTLEATTAGEKAGYDNANTPAQILDALRLCGTDIVSLGTERILDKGYAGLDETLAELTSRGMTGIGAADDAEDRKAVIKVRGMQIAVLAYTYGLSEQGMEATADDQRGVLARLRMQEMVRDIAAARAEGAQAVIVMPHWGTKNVAEIPGEVRKMAQELAEAGADVILGTHPNVVQRAERLQVVRADGLSYDCAVYYSLGSLLTDARTAENTAGMIAQIALTYDPLQRRLSVGEMEATPIYIAKQKEEERTVYRVTNPYDETACARLTPEEQQACMQAAEAVMAAAGIESKTQEHGGTEE